MLPDCNRQATQTLSETQEFPTFHEFASFMLAEAEIAWNPIRSFNALHAEANKEANKTKASVFHTKMVHS